LPGKRCKGLDSHFNIDLSAINIAKIAHWYAIPKEQRNTFPMKNIKINHHNALLLERLFSIVCRKSKLA
jgi:hypothetical protein